MVKKILTYVRNNRKWVYMVLAIIIMIVTLFAIKVSVKINKPLQIVYSIQPHIEPEAAIFYESIGKDKVIKQSFVSSDDFQGFSIAFMANGDNPKGNTYVKLIEKSSNKLLLDDNVDNAKVDKDKLVRFNLEFENYGEANKEYELVISGDVENHEDGLSIYMNPSGYYKQSNDVQYVPAKKVVSIGTFRFTYQINTLYDKMFVVMAFVFIVMAVTFTLFYDKLHIVAFMCILSMGGLYMILFPPGKIHDADIHYNVMYTLSNDLLGIHGEKHKDWDGSEYTNVIMRADDYEIYEKFMHVTDGYYNNPNANDYIDVVHKIKEKDFDKSLMETPIPAIREGVVPYAPYIIGFTLARLLKCNGMLSIYIAQVVALFTSAFLASCAIKIIPYAKEMLMCVLLLPTSLLQFSSLSYDGITIALSMIFIAMVVKLYAKSEAKQDDNKVLAGAFIVILLLAGCKGGAYSLLGLMLLPYVNKRIPLKFKLMGFAAIVLIMIIAFASKYDTILTKMFAGEDAMYDFENSSYSYAFAVHHPVQFLVMVVGTFVEKPDYYLGGMFGAYLGWNKLVVPIAVIMPLVFFTIMETMCTTNESTVIKKHVKLMVIAILLLFTVAMSAMMLYLTPIGWNINGLDGRYYVPFLPLILLLFRGNGIRVSDSVKKKLLVAYGYWDIIVAFYVLWYACAR